MLFRDKSIYLILKVLRNLRRALRGLKRDRYGLFKGFGWAGEILDEFRVASPGTVSGASRGLLQILGNEGEVGGVQQGPVVKKATLPPALRVAGNFVPVHGEVRNSLKPRVKAERT